MAPKQKIPRNYAKDSAISKRIGGLSNSIKQKHPHNPCAAISEGTIIYQFNRCGVTNRDLLDSILSMCKYVRSEYAKSKMTSGRLKYALMAVSNDTNIVHRDEILSEHEIERNRPHIGAIFDDIRAAKIDAPSAIIPLIQEALHKHSPDSVKAPSESEKWNVVNCSICHCNFKEGQGVYLHRGGCSAMMHWTCIHALIEYSKTNDRIFHCPFCLNSPNEYIVEKYTPPKESVDSANESDNPEESSEIEKAPLEHPLCEICNIDMVLKRTRFGTQFWGCPNYGDKYIRCKTTRNVSP